MPTLGAMGIAFVVSYVAGDLVPDSFGMVVQFLVGTVVWYAVFYKSRAWLLAMRNG